MPRVPGISHRRAVRALERAGFRVERRRSKHTRMSRGEVVVFLPRHNPINPFTMGSIIVDAGLTVEEFRGLL